MYIKLIFTSDKGQEPLYRILAYIINNASINSAATLATALSNTGIFAADIGAGFDSANSQIIRTVGLSANTIAHIAKPAVANCLYFTLQQAVYDSPSTFYYTQLKPSTNIANTTIDTLQGNGLTGGTMASSQLAQTQAATAATAGGTILSLTNTSTDYSTGFGIQAYSSWRSLHCYITDKTFWIGFSLVGGATGVGWNGLYTSQQTTSGVFVSQYTRLDHWNTAANSIIPVAATRMTASYNGLFSATSHYNSTTVLVDGSTSTIYTQIWPLKVLNLINSPINRTTGTYSRDFHRIVSHDLGSHRISSGYGLTAARSFTNTSLNSSPAYGQVHSTAATARIANATNTAVAFAIHPLTWSNSYVGALGGGNISEQSGVYVFQGDYAPGDEFTFNSKTYTIWPTMINPTTSRLGFAIPKE